jgi:hypothetical protein
MTNRQVKMMAEAGREQRENLPQIEDYDSQITDEDLKKHRIFSIRFFL